MVSLIPAGRTVSLTPWHWIALQDGQGKFLSTLEVSQKQGCGTWGHYLVLNGAVLGSLLGSVIFPTLIPSFQAVRNQFSCRGISTGLHKQVKCLKIKQITGRYCLLYIICTFLLFSIFLSCCW